MRQLIIISSVFLLSCKHRKIDTTALTKTIWVNADINFDTLRLDTTAYIVHGSGILLQFDTTETFKSLSNDLYLLDDTISWGEPLANFKLGKWAVRDEKIISTSTYIEGSATELLGRQTLDTFDMIGDSLISDKKKYIPARLLSKELTDIFGKNWPQFDKKNGK